MIFTHDTESALASAVVLVNSAEQPETLDTVEQLDAFFADHEYSGSRDPDREAELAAVRALRPRLRALLTASRDVAARLTNDILREHRAMPQLVRHDGWDYHLHATLAQDPLTDRIAVETAMAMIDVVRADELSRLSLCADKTCEAIALDLSRNRSRRYCSTTCGNRNAVAAYRERRGSSAG